MNQTRLFRAIALSAFFAPSSFSAEPVVSSGGVYSLEGALALAVAPTLTGGSFSLENGAFSSVLVVETSRAPTLRIEYNSLNITVTWSGALNAFRLEQTTAVGEAAWLALPATQQSAAGEIRVSIPIASQKQFLRLTSAE